MNSVTYKPNGVEHFKMVSSFDNLFLFLETFNPTIKVYACDSQIDEREETVTMTDSTVFFVKDAQKHDVINHWQEHLFEKYHPEERSADSAIFFSIRPATHDFHSDHESVHLVGLFGKTVYRIYTDNGTEEFLLQSGDYLFIPRGVPHRAMSLTPRAVLSTGFFL